MLRRTRSRMRDRRYALPQEAPLAAQTETGGKVVRALLALTGPDAAQARRSGQVAHLRPRVGRPWPTEVTARPQLIDFVEGKRHMDLIEINALRLRCVIGCRDEERRERSDVVIDLRIGTDTRPAARSDELADAWNYRAPTKAIIAEVERSAYRTVEALAEEIARILVIDHRALYAMVRLRKPGALRFADTVGVVIERTPGDFRDIAAENSGDVVADAALSGEPS